MQYTYTNRSWSMENKYACITWAKGTCPATSKDLHFDYLLCVAHQRSVNHYLEFTTYTYHKVLSQWQLMLLLQFQCFCVCAFLACLTMYSMHVCMYYVGALLYVCTYIYQGNKCLHPKCSHNYVHTYIQL